MSHIASERRLIENQAVFRSINESVQKDIDKANAVAKEEGVKPVEFDEDAPLFFYCECSDENCKKRIKISLKSYNKIHSSRDTFTIVRGHEIKEVEAVTANQKEYSVVTKYRQPGESPDKLQATDVDNSST